MIGRATRLRLAGARRLPGSRPVLRFAESTPRARSDTGLGALKAFRCQFSDIAPGMSHVRYRFCFVCASNTDLSMIPDSRLLTTDHWLFVRGYENGGDIVEFQRLTGSWGVRQPIYRITHERLLSTIVHHHFGGGASASRECDRNRNKAVIIISGPQFTRDFHSDLRFFIGREMLRFIANGIGEYEGLLR